MGSRRFPAAQRDRRLACDVGSEQDRRLDGMLTLRRMFSDLSLLPSIRVRTYARQNGQVALDFAPDAAERDAEHSLAGLN